MPARGDTAVELVVTARFTVDATAVDHLAGQFADSLRAMASVVSVAVDTPARSALHVVPVPALIIDIPSRTVRLRGARLEVSRRMFDLLLFLARRPGKVCTRHTLLADVWGTPDPTRSRTVDVHIRRLRALLGPDLPLITTVRQVGYRLDAGADLRIEE